MYERQEFSFSELVPEQIQKILSQEKENALKIGPPKYIISFLRICYLFQTEIWRQVHPSWFADSFLNQPSHLIALTLEVLPKKKREELEKYFGLCSKYKGKHFEIHKELREVLLHHFLEHITAGFVYQSSKIPNSFQALFLKQPSPVLKKLGIYSILRIAITLDQRMQIEFLHKLLPQPDTYLGLMKNISPPHRFQLQRIKRFLEESLNFKKESLLQNIGIYRIAYALSCNYIFLPLPFLWDINLGNLLLKAWKKFKGTVKQEEAQEEMNLICEDLKHE
jgi:hypothetical protein